jgi:hypothetical protein
MAELSDFLWVVLTAVKWVGQWVDRLVVPLAASKVFCSAVVKACSWAEGTVGSLAASKADGMVVLKAGK